jgi:hypothetical protein
MLFESARCVASGPKGSPQITHITDSDTNAERDYIIAELRKNRSIEAVKVYQSGQDLFTERVNHYATDREIALASLVMILGSWYL